MGMLTRPKLVTTSHKRPSSFQVLPVVSTLHTYIHQHVRPLVLHVSFHCNAPLPILPYQESQSKSLPLQPKQNPKTMSRKTMEVVKNLDVQRYMGRWYEIASFPSFFQPKNGVNTRATYNLNDDQTVHVLNETFNDGKRVSIEGTAYKADSKSDEAKLKVKFYLPPFLPIIPVVGNYWVLYIDDDYQYVLVGEPTRKYLWILCRQTQLDDEIYNQLVQKAKDEGYDVSKLHKTQQSDPPPEGDNIPKDRGGWWIKSLFGK